MATRTTRRRDTEPPGRVAAKGLVVVALAAVLLYVAVSSYSGVPGRHYRTMYAQVPQIGNLIQHDQVRIAGVRVGQVLGVRVARDGEARLRLQLEPGTQLPADTGIAVRANGLLGARYVQLLPGRSTRTLDDGATIRGSAAALTPGVTDALDVLDRQTRGALGDTVGVLGQGLLGQGSALNTAIRINATVQPEFLDLVDAIRARPGADARLLPALQRATQALDGAGQALPDSMRAGADALAPFAARQADVARTLTAAPPALAAATAGLGHGRELLAAADALARAAQRTLPPAPAGLRRAAALLRTSRTPLARTDALLRAAVPAVPAALKITGALRPLLGPLGQGIGDLIPMVTQIGRYGCDIENLGAVFRSMTGFGGTGSGPGGPAMEFRLQAIPSQETVGALTPGPSLVTRDGYPAPCKYASRPYPLTVGLPGAATRSGR